ncbi:hypothetical protein SAMN05443633_110119 [Chryseobacterium arachidis]|uniref:Uncharacterized protein n=1 Tax=Chryseobacterium arachidis TaxID=1416778 RepID=A0A1M5H8X3_9FLAO|nr:hypothetical protein SAMN05443633_110119 [Chryseobacterium arachidis]
MALAKKYNYLQAFVKIVRSAGQIPCLLYKFLLHFE